MCIYVAGKLSLNLSRVCVCVHRVRVLLCAAGELHEEDLLANDSSVVVVTAAGYIKRMPLEDFTAQNRCEGILIRHNCRTLYSHILLRTPTPTPKDRF